MREAARSNDDILGDGGAWSRDDDEEEEARGCEYRSEAGVSVSMYERETHRYTQIHRDTHTHLRVHRRSSVSIYRLGKTKCTSPVYVYVHVVIRT